MIVLGIVPAIHDPSVCIVENGEILSFIEEERLIREKHAHNTFPIEACEEALKIASVELDDIDFIAVPRNFGNQKRFYPQMVRAGLRSKGTVGERLYLTLVRPLIWSARSNDDIRDQVNENLKRRFGVPPDEIAPLRFVDHHMSHATSAYLPSPFDRSLVVTMDCWGDYLSTAIYIANEGNLTRIEGFHPYNSLGRFYATTTEVLGYRTSNGEGKVMGLAPYGEPNTELADQFGEYLKVKDGRYDLTELTYRDDADRKLLSDIQMEVRDKKGEISQIHKDLAKITQDTLEEALIHVVEYHIQETDIHNVCLAGGVALNCKVNKEIRCLDSVNDLFVQPVANDAGGSLGAALSVATDEGYDVPEMTDPFLGTDYSNADISAVLSRLNIRYQKMDSPVSFAAKALDSGELIGWFQGRMEVGPRALGHRSILADPRTTDSRDKVNKRVKNREEWRPFAPSMLPSETDRFLVGDTSPAARFMIDSYATTDNATKEIPAVLHPQDGTTRPQIVDSEVQPRYAALLSEFKEHSGVGVLLNTSFNDSGEPIVRTPREAVRDFFAMGLDHLIIENIVVTKHVDRGLHAVN